jgi:16S rRNA (guanine527-N7)-methyltransferase
VNSPAIAQAIGDAGLESLTPKALAQFETYLALLLKWNARLNLTAVREPAAIIRRHLLESIQCAQILPRLSAESTLLDFGSGAGLPGVPIAICRPEINVTLAESQRKKAAFLQEVVRSLDINAKVFDGRVEEMPLKKSFSVVTLRAVDKMVEACRSAVPRIASRGWLALFATNETEAELKAALPEITWQQKLPIFDLDRGVLLLGQRSK